VKLILCGIYDIQNLKYFYNIFLTKDEYHKPIKILAHNISYMYNNLIPFSHLLEKFGDILILDDLNVYQEFKQMAKKKKELFLDIVNNKQKFSFHVKHSDEIKENDSMLIQKGSSKLQQNANLKYLKYFKTKKKYIKLKNKSNIKLF
jgi:hypothetical protein